MTKLNQPMYLLLLLPLLIIGITYLLRNQGITFSSLTLIPRQKSLRSRLTFLPPLFYIIGIASLIFALSRPVKQVGDQKEKREGLILEMIIDRSGSMGTIMDTKGETNRLDIVKDVFRSFVLGDEKGLEGRPDDMIGLVSFARYADTQSPLTSSHDVLGQFIDQITLATEEEDGTSIGDALALGVARIASFRQNMPNPDTQGVIILLTDGQNNSGNRTPEDAAELAAKYDIKVYTIGFSGGYYRNAFGMISEVPVGYGMDQESLEAIAETTGGEFFLANDEKSLRQIYDKIDSMEKTELANISYNQQDELFYPFLLWGFIILLLGIILDFTALMVVEDEL